MSIEPRPRPHHAYKAELQNRIASFEPRSILDIGCGKGELIASPVLQGCALRVGLEVDEADVEALRAQGLDARLGRAETLPFQDASFDIVTLDYVAHHVTDLSSALSEAARVAGKAVIVLDPWYDVSLPSQQVALAFDGWLKSIDRRLGMTHNTCPLAGELALPFQRIGGFELEHRYWLIHQSIPESEVADMAARQLARVNEAGEFKASLEPIVAQLEIGGMSEDGAILFVAERAA